MSAARIIVEYQGELMDDRVIPIRKAVLVGDDESAVVAFPGWTLRLAPWGEGVSVGGEPLRYGQRRSWRWDDVNVCVESVRHEEAHREPVWRSDIRFPVLMFSAFLLLLSVESGRAVIADTIVQDSLHRAGWVLLPNRDVESKPSANPDFDLDEVGRYGVFQTRLGSSKVPLP
jgi:hypothetical protein